MFLPCSNVEKIKGPICVVRLLAEILTVDNFFARYIQQCHIQYGTSAPKTVMQFLSVMNIVCTCYYYSSIE